MDSASVSNDPALARSASNRPTRPLPQSSHSIPTATSIITTSISSHANNSNNNGSNNSHLSNLDRDPNHAINPPDLGGTLVSHTPDTLAEMSSDSDDDDGVGSGSKRRKGKGKYNVPRRQIKIEYIQDKSRRNITFGKRKNGIFKKAQEISTLTGCEVMLIVAPKDSELQAYTYATTRLQPLVSDPAGEAYIQNCLRYGALMPGTSSSTISSNYGLNGSNNQGSHVSTLRTGPRVSPAPNPTAVSYNSLYSYVNNPNVPRRTQLSYGMPHPLAISPQSSPSTNVTNTHTPQSTNVSDQSKRDPSDSPVQHLGLPHAHRSSSAKQQQPQQWSPGPTVPSTEFPSSPAVGGPNSSSLSSSTREIPADWVVAHPRSLFQTSSPLGPSPMAPRGFSSFPLQASTAGNGHVYHGLTAEGSNPFQRPSPDGPIISASAWSTLSQNSPGITTAPLQPAQSIGSNHTSTVANEGNESGFLEPLVLSQPYDSRNFVDDPLNSGSSSNYHHHPNRVSSGVNMTSSVSPYGESDHFDHSAGYLPEDNAEAENKSYVLENPEHSWASGIH